MRKYIYQLVAFLLLSFPAKAIQVGSMAENPIKVTVGSEFTVNSITVTPCDWGANPEAQTLYGSPIYYQLTINMPTVMFIHNLESEPASTRITVYLGNTPFPSIVPKEAYYDYLTENGIWKESSSYPEQWSPYQDCFGALLRPGVYTVVVEGKKSGNVSKVNGLIKTTFVSFQPNEFCNPYPLPFYVAGCRQNPIDLGTLQTGFFEDLHPNLGIYPNSYRQQDPDIYYNFELEKQEKLSWDVITEGYPEVFILNENGSMVSEGKSEATLPVGRYTMVLESSAPVTDFSLFSFQTLILPIADEFSCIKEDEEETIYLNEKIPKYNYIKELTYTSADHSSFLENITYYDGLGRPVETVQKGITPNQSDLVQYQEYDRMGRESRSWLPAVVANNNGGYKDFSRLESAIASTYSDNKPYSKPLYENSPLSRVVQQTGAGENWHEQKKAVKTQYLLNTTAYSCFSCKSYIIDISTNASAIKNGGRYRNSELEIVRTQDEDGRETLTFTNPIGQTVLVRSILGEDQFADTYYLYDIYGNLAAVLPPLASAAMQSGQMWNSETSDVLKKYAYLYRYDDRNRCIAKRLPGCEWTYYVYDDADRLIFSQDGNQRKSNQWAFTLPDAFGRTCVTGICGKEIPDISETVVTVQRDNAQSLFKGYTLVDGNIELTDPKILSVNYYDDYTFLGNNGVPSSDFAYEETDFGTRYKNAKMQLTGTVTAILDGSIDDEEYKYLYSVMYYDDRDRMIQQKSTNHLGGYEKVYTSYDFTGHPLQQKHVHTTLGKTVTELYTYEYDHAGRLLTTKHKINDGEEIFLAANEYDELGRLKSCKRNNSSNLQTDYAYNVRGWTTKIESPLFAEHLYYNESHNGSTPQYGGNISAMDWQTQSEDLWRGYSFSYDPLSRLTRADYSENGQPDFKFDTRYSYDLMGNILTLERNGKQDNRQYEEIDNVTFTYNGNQLVKADDGIDGPYYAGAFHFTDGADEDEEYAYDGNGNMTKDLNKNISSIEYNFLNLPAKITFGNGNVAEYTYTANGTKLKTEYFVKEMDQMQLRQEACREYCGSYIYENGMLSQILVDGGYVKPVYKAGIFPMRPNPKNYSSEEEYQAAMERWEKRVRNSRRLTGFDYYFYLTDHLGNNREVVDATGEIVQENHYYPFGGLMGESIDGDAQRYKYNGKELDRMNGLDWMDYGARMYDGGRFTTVDPLAEKKPWQSPYVYGRNNPLRFVDPDGNDDWDKVVGFAYGIVTNVIPGTGNLRDSYTPNNSADYNAGLKSADQASNIIGTALVLDGGRNVATGLGVASASAAVTVASAGVAAPVAGVSGTVGAATAATGALEAGAGAVMLANTSGNSSKGYNRGNTISRNQANEAVKRKQAPKDIERVDRAHQTGGQPHVHLKNGRGAINADGSGHDGPKPKLTKKEVSFIKKIEGFSNINNQKRLSK